MSNVKVALVNALKLSKIPTFTDSRAEHPWNRLLIYLTFSGFRKMLSPNVLRDVHPLNMPLIEVDSFAQLNISEPTFSKLVHPWNA